MVFDPVTSEQRKQFYRQGYGAHVPGYTGHCPTLKFRVGKRFGASTEEIMKELLEKKILKTGPYRPNSGKDVLLPIARERDIRRDWKNNAHMYKTPPFILGYTGYIPGFNNIYGLPFMRAVEEGGKEWREVQNKLRARRDAMRAHVERTNPRNLLSRARTDNVDVEIDHGFDRDKSFFDNQVTADRPPIVGYTGHIPGAKSEISLSRRYAQAARKGLQSLHEQRKNRLDSINDSETIQRVLDTNYLDDTGHTRA
ncbi:protein FAM166B-like [Microplitis demolitor]|uniref:protein FAM166B-like n=1 Tax=Microplitis demolitor TaxID=69319 RepID=UPI0004CD7834|nr:protein FAM166B-like [Microplitis demolitor]